jgi:hypothetical protein
MEGSAGGGEHPPTVRASDADREDAVARLSERFAAGELSQDTFVCRMEAALHARSQHELAELFADLRTPRRRGWPRWSGRAAAGLTRLGSRLSASAAAARESVLAQVPRLSLRAAPPALAFPAGNRVSFTIGRDPDCDLVIHDITVSRQHAGLDRVMRGWLLTDLGSTNGTRLNGWRVREPVPVSAGDQVSFGAVTFVLRGSPPGEA